MTIFEYIEYVLHHKEQAIGHMNSTSEEDAVAVADLVSGSFSYLFYQTIWLNDYSMESLTAHLEALYDSSDHHGFIYLIIMLADSVDFRLPAQFYEMSVSDVLRPILCAAMIEDWLDYDTEYEEIEESAMGG